MLYFLHQDGNEASPKLLRGRFKMPRPRRNTATAASAPAPAPTPAVVADPLAAALAAAESRTAAAPTSRRKEMPVVADNPTTKAKVDRLLSVGEQLDSIEAAYAEAETDVLLDAAPERENLCASAYVGSVKVPGSARSVSLIWANSYSKLDKDGAAAAKGIIGDDRFSRYFKEDITVAVENNDDLAFLVSKIGEDKFADIFKVTRNFKPTAAYNEEFHTRSFTPAEREQLAATVVQRKPSVRRK
jgi:hypothetical protein